MRYKEIYAFRVSGLCRCQGFINLCNPLNLHEIIFSENVNRYQA